MVIGNLKILSRAEYRSDYQSALIATLGPSGTSSEFVAGQLSENIALFPSYELAEEHIHIIENEAVFLVANAYQNINRFYISERTKPVAAFFCDTPTYVLASRVTRFQDLARQPRISSHRAPAHLIERILANSEFTLVETDSTSVAARMAAESAVDACITTRVACEKEGLNILYESGTIPMLWTIFSRK